jgi:uncharacterized protein YndB with AHSA1/START domain
MLGEGSAAGHSRLIRRAIVLAPVHPLQELLGRQGDCLKAVQGIDETTCLPGEVRQALNCHAVCMARTDSASRVIHADLERVFVALVDADALARWLPPSGMTGRFEHFDARPGGSYRLVLTYKEDVTGSGKATSDSDIVEARFVDVVPNVRVVQETEFVSDDPAFAGTMTMTWEVAADDRGTRVEIRADDVPAGITPEDHAEGMASSLANLAAFVEAGRG